MGVSFFYYTEENGQVRFLTDLRKINNLLVRKPYPIPRILDIIQTLQGFTYATALDLNMGYYTIELDDLAKKICTIVTPWGKYSYQRLPMGVKCAPDIFQEKMGTLMADLEFVRTYLDDLLVMSNGTFEQHVKKLSIVLDRLERAGLRVHIQKSSFFQDSVEYLGYVITRDGVKPQYSKVHAILNLKPPQNVREVRRIVGMIQYYRDIWPRRSHTLAPLMELISTKGLSTNQKNNKLRKIEWSDNCQKAFDEMKKLISRNVLLSYPRFDQPFEVYTDASTIQLGAVIMQSKKTTCILQ